jgi:hypothetical protein
MTMHVDFKTTMVAVLFSIAGIAAACAVAPNSSRKQAQPPRLSAAMALTSA